MQNNFYPKSPSGLPLNFTTPGKAYKKHILIASLVLFLFMLLYIGLSFFFLYKSYKLFGAALSGEKNEVLSFITAVILGFLGVFMAKALFFINKRDKSTNIEIKEEDEPLLFEFIYKIADEAKAPRPHKVFLSTIVNASVFYDVSLVNLIFPTRKNLEIGIGLVNSLNIGEFKAILAHEFGHFTQRSMIIGRWVNVANKIAYQIIAKRDRLDAFLNGLSHTDLRIAWVGWILSIIVWSIRAISESFFKVVILAQRALSREMEFHADLVAVSLTGSDTMVNSLYKLTAADEAYEQAIAFVNRQLKKNKAVDDVYALQSNFIRQTSIALNNPAYGTPPVSEPANAEAFRVFKDAIAQPPKMWSTHPSNVDREKNAKRVYIQSESNEQSSWCLFKNPDKTKNQLTLTLYKDLKVETTPLSKQEGLDIQNKEFQRSFLLPKYRGVYLNRDLLISFKDVKDVYSLNLDFRSAVTQIPLLYPESIQAQLEHLKNLNEEIEMLEGLNNKVLDAKEDKINYRGRLISRKELPDVIEQAKREAESANAKIIEHDKLCRNIPHAIAAEIGKGWKEYLVSVATLIHYCEHLQKVIETKSRFFYDTLAEVSKVHRVDDTEMAALLSAGSELRTAMGVVFTQGKVIKLSARIVEKLEGKQFADLLEPFELMEPTRANINSWIGAVSSWINLTVSTLTLVKEASLDELLYTESFLEQLGSSAETIDQAPVPVIIDDGYPRFDPNEKKEVAIKLNFISKIYLAHGTVPAIGRMVIAGSIVLFAVFFSGSLAKTTVILYNGLPLNVNVKIGDHSTSVDANEVSQIEIDDLSDLTVETSTGDGEVIESFKPEKLDNSRTYIYNVANAAIIYKWYVVYGSETPPEWELLGAPRWSEVNADYYFETPPKSMQVREGGSATKTVVSAYPTLPFNASIIADEKDRTNFILQHALREKRDSPEILYWLSLASNLKTFPAILEKRLAADPLEVVSLRAQQDYLEERGKQKICEQHHQLYSKNTTNADLYYIETRCMPDNPQQDSAFLQGYKKWPDNGWLAYASGYVYMKKQEWEKAVTCLDVAIKKEPELKEVLGEELKRVYQLLKKDSMMTQLNNLHTPYMEYVTTIEKSTKNEPDNRFYAFKLLAKGQISEALDYCKSDTTIYKPILRLAAVSDNVSDSTLNVALALSPYEGITNYTLLPAIALLAKKHMPTTAYKVHLKEMLGNYSDSVYKFITAVQSAKLKEADAMLASFNVELKGKVSLVGVILLGDGAPEKWKLFASELLFINEKPYRVEKISDERMTALKN